MNKELHITLKTKTFKQSSYVFRLHLVVSSDILTEIILRNMMCASSENILVIPGPMYSHVRPLMGMVDLLIKQNDHNVTILVTEELSGHEGLRDLSAQIITHDKDEKISKETDKLVNLVVEGNLQNKGILFLGRNMRSTIINITHLYMTDSEIFKKLEGQHFKTVIIDGLLSLPFLILAHKLSIPEVVYCAVSLLPKMIYRTPSDYLSIPEFPGLLIPDPTSLISRFQSLCGRIGIILLGTFGKSLFFPDDVVSKYVSTSSLDEFYKKTNTFSFYLLDQEEILDYPRPSLPNIAYVGGLSLSNSLNPLPNQIQRHIESAKDGIIVASFGSHSNMPGEFKASLYEAFQNIPEIHFIAKIDKSHFKEKNILTVPWLPQNDLLANKRIKAFITHCGNSGQYEALYHGVPMIAIPIFGDQHYNADRIVIKSFGVKLDHNTLTPEGLERSIREVVYNEKYSRKIKIASEMYRSKPLNSSQRAAYWVHHVTSYGSSHLRSSSHILPDYKYFGLDIFLLLFIIFLSVVCLIVYVFRLICNCCMKKKLKSD
ncbi:UDP-glucuronosyltransferase 2C1-like [Saccostrea echinata]|uniref:UDP-glucuronosyltransferase 2C1-like n=1 Tax=Saccostrea echinata TaxID=191078 RepID=UPI002A829A58|nr:UDP-glucuronosyltransferase 2C1-like [Saccostrea echinata]